MRLSAFRVWLVVREMFRDYRRVPQMKEAAKSERATEGHTNEGGTKGGVNLPALPR